MSNAPEVRPTEETMMTETRRKAPAARVLLSALFTLLAVALSSPSEVRAQWTSPDASGNIGNTNTGNVRVGGPTTPSAVLHIRGNLSSPLTGTVAVTQNSATVTGTGTAFATELSVGDSIKIGSEVFTVSAIASATSLTLDSVYAGATASGANAYRDPNLFAVDNGEGLGKFTLTRSGNVGIGTATPQQKLAVEGSLAVRPSNAKYFIPTVPLHVFGTSIASRTNPAVQEVLTLSQSNNATGGGGFQSKGSHFSMGLSFWEDPGNNYPRTRVDFRTSGRATDAESTPNTVMSLRDDGNVGVGTTTPGYTLDVVSSGQWAARFKKTDATHGGILVESAAGYNPNVALSVNGAMKWYMNSNVASGDALQFWEATGSFPRFTLTQAGNVGIGTAAPAHRLDVAGNVNASGLCLGGACKTNWSELSSQWTSGIGGTLSYLVGNVGVGTSTPIRGLHVSGPNGLGSSEFVLENTGMPANNRKFNLWGNAAAGASGRFFLRLLNDAGNAATRDFMAFDNATGYVGVGTTAPASLLEVRRDQPTSTDVLVNNADTAGFSRVYLNNGSPSTSGGFLQWNNNTGSNNLFVATVGSSPLYLGTNNTVRLTVLPTNGNVGIGTTSPTSRLHVGGQADNLFHVASTGSGATDTVASFASATGTVMAMRGNGNVGVGTGTPGARLDVGAGAAARGAYTDFLIGTGGNNPQMEFYGPTKSSAIAHDESMGGLVFYTNGPVFAPSFFVGNNGNVGVGTTAPGHKLDVAGNVNASGLCLGGTCKTSWSDIGGGSSQWVPGASSSINYGAGNVGVGTTTPAARLHVVGGARVEGTGRIYLGAIAPSGARGLEFVEESPTTISIRHHDPWVAWRNISINPYGGNLGVGNLNPLGPLSVGDASMDGSDGYVVMGKKAGASTRQMRMGYDANFNFIIGDFGSGNIVSPWTPSFAINWQAPANSLHINSAGNVGIGTASPTHKLEVEGSLHASGAITGATISATYQDVAEWVPSTQKLAAGTVVILDAGKVNHVVASASAYDTKVAGVISAQPGVILGVGGDDKVKVATTGRVRVRVDASRGGILVGDLLVTSDVEGVAMKSVPMDFGGARIHRPGTIIGKALEPLEKGVGEILVLLSLQ